MIKISFHLVVSSVIARQDVLRPMQQRLPFIRYNQLQLCHYVFHPKILKYVTLKINLWTDSRSLSTCVSCHCPGGLINLICAARASHKCVGGMCSRYQVISGGFIFYFMRSFRMKVWYFYCLHLNYIFVQFFKNDCKHFIWINMNTEIQMFSSMIWMYWFPSKFLLHYRNVHY